MNLTDDDKKKITEWLNQKCDLMKCLACGSNQWELAPISTLQIGIDIHTTRFHYHSGIPLLGITCINCGFVMQFNPVIMGFKPDPPEKPKIHEGGEQAV